MQFTLSQETVTREELEKQLRDRNDELDNSAKQHAVHVQELSQQLEQARKETAQFKQLEREHEAELARMEEEEKISGVFKKPKPRDDSLDHLLPGLPPNVINNGNQLRTISRGMGKPISNKSPDKSKTDKKGKKATAQQGKAKPQLNKVSVPTLAQKQTK